MEWFKSGASDIGAAWQKRSVWLTLAGEDITDQHRRTTLGPLWLLINYLAFTGTFVLLFGHTASGSNFAAYVAIGLFVWQHISEVINLSVTLFVREESYIKGTKLPLSTYVFQMTTQSTIRSGYALIGCIGILLLTGQPITPAWLWSLVGLAILVLTTPAAVIVFAMAGAYFPDLQFVVSNVIRMGIFLTPIFWMRDQGMGLRAALFDWNPFTYFLEVVRAPIISGSVSLMALAITLCLAALLWILALLLLGAGRRQIVFVL